MPARKFEIGLDGVGSVVGISDNQPADDKHFVSMEVVYRLLRGVAHDMSLPALLIFGSRAKKCESGIENVLDTGLAFLRARSKNEERRQGHIVGNATQKAIDYLHRNKMFIVGGLIVGNPDDTSDSIEANLEFARRHVDWPYIQHPTPYPRTPMTADLRKQDLIVNDRVEQYDGTTAVVRTRDVAPLEMEFMRWRAERWMKLRHFPVAFLHNPSFILRNGRGMLKH